MELLVKFYLILDSSNITLETFCKYYNVDVAELIECEPPIIGKILDFIKRITEKVK